MKNGTLKNINIVKWIIVAILYLIQYVKTGNVGYLTISWIAILGLDVFTLHSNK